MRLDKAHKAEWRVKMEWGLEWEWMPRAASETVMYVKPLERWMQIE